MPGTGIERNDSRFLEMLAETDMVISKGQGNFEALSEQPDIYFLFMAKCVTLANDLGVEKGDIILMRS